MQGQVLVEQYEVSGILGEKEQRTIPRIRLADLPTPIHSINYPSLCREVYVKRDDHTGLVSSGNKVRKLEFLLADAMSKGCDSVVTIGAVQSNHCRATSVCAQRVGLECFLILRTDTPVNELAIDGNYLLDLLTNSRIRTVSVETYRKIGSRDLVFQLCDQLRAQGKKPYPIVMGGSDGVGTWGYIEAFREIESQFPKENRDFPFDHIFFSTGSGGTAAGLAIAAKLLNTKTEIHAICVCDNQKYFEEEIDRIIIEMQLQNRWKAKEIIDIIDDYKGIGYSMNTDEEIRALIDIARSSGLIFDPTYTLKAFIGMTEEIKKEAYAGKKILFIHTGGLFTLLAHEKTSFISRVFATLNPDICPMNIS